VTDLPLADSEPARFATLLLVEDEIWIRMDLAERFRSAGLKVIEADNGADALTVLHAVRVDLVVTDLLMPRMDGAALVRQIRAHFPQVPVLMVAGQLPPPDVYRLLNGFFSKPLDVDTFMNYLRSIVTAGPEPTG
jgi:CheY-like chemotaxis protein